MENKEWTMWTQYIGVYTESGEDELTLLLVRKCFSPLAGRLYDWLEFSVTNNSRIRTLCKYRLCFVGTIVTGLQDNAFRHLNYLSIQSSTGASDW